MLNRPALFGLLFLVAPFLANCQDTILEVDLKAPPAFDFSSEIYLEQPPLLRHLQILSADDMEGRQTGEKGNLKAQGYILEVLYSHQASVELQPFSFKKNGKELLGTNIIATIKGYENPERFLAVTAHFDHVGIEKKNTGDSIFNGADDNASGTSALLELVKYFKNHPPKNSILFIFFDAEEMGLQGAKFFNAENKKEILLNINLDMVSRSEQNELYACGTAYSPELRNYMLLAANTTTALKVKLGHDGLDGKDSWVQSSDHYEFFKKNIPFLYFGVEDHEDYHQPSDEFENIDPAFYFEAVKFIAQTIENLDKNFK